MTPSPLDGKEELKDNPQECSVQMLKLFENLSKDS